MIRRFTRQSAEPDVIDWLGSAGLPVQVAALLPVICASGAQLPQGRILCRPGTGQLRFRRLKVVMMKRDLLGVAARGADAGANGTAGAGDPEA